MSKKKIGLLSLPIDRLHIEVTNHCNFSCEFCPDFKMKREKNFMDFGVLKKILNEVAEEGIVRLVLFHVMGEPFLYPRLLEAIKYAAGKNIDTCITTNGSLLTAELLAKMIEAGTSSVILSLQTPDEESFKFRGAKSISFNEYRDKIKKIARLAISEKTFNLTISFFSSPLRRLLIPLMPNISIADTSRDLRQHLLNWSDIILKGTVYEKNLKEIQKSLNRVKSFKGNRITITPNLTFETRIMGDWSDHPSPNGIKAKIGFCPGIQENFGILWNGDFVFCCVDYEGKTINGNVKDMSVSDYLGSPHVQEVVKGFNKFKIVHPYCQECLGDRNYLNAFVRQIGSILYFKGIRRFFS